MSYRYARALGALLFSSLLGACGAGGNSAPAGPAPMSDVATLQSLDLKAGDGEQIEKGQLAVVNYTGWLYEASAADHKGKEFDSSIKSGKPFTFPVGSGSVIKGWDQGVVGMKVGGRRRLTIPPDLAYGDNGAGGVIPPGATLVFDVDLLSIQK